MGPKHSLQSLRNSKEGALFSVNPRPFHLLEKLQEITAFWEFKVTVGIHPKHARKVGESEVHQFKRLVGHPQVAVTRVGSRKDSYASAKQ